MKIEIIRGDSSCDVAYTVRGNTIHRGGSYSDVVYYINGDFITGLDGSIAYTINGNQIYRGHTTEIAYTIKGNSIIYGYSSYQVAYTIRRDTGYNRNESAREESWEDSEGESSEGHVGRVWDDSEEDESITISDILCYVFSIALGLVCLYWLLKMFGIEIG